MINQPLTVREMLRWLEDLDDDTLIIFRTRDFHPLEFSESGMGLDGKYWISLEVGEE